MLILFSITPIGCLLAMLVGLLVAWYLFPTRFVNARIEDLPQEETDEIVIMAAADFAEHQDVERARELLDGLKVPNKAQYVSMVAERLIRTHRGPIDAEIENVVRLADALGVSTVSMIAFVSTPTPSPSPTPLPTPTPTNTLVVPVAEAQVETQAAVEAAQAVEEAPPTEEPTPEPVPTDLPTAIPPTPAPPTATPE
ncbi:MAG: hypothetical protein AB1801_15575, partial [Chloroflexota bacterium]